MTGWMHRAECAGLDPEVWFPDERDLDGIEAARQVCHHCPVRDECLAWAMRRDLYGIWGATTRDERRRERDRARRRRAA